MKNILVFATFLIFELFSKIKLNQQTFENVIYLFKVGLILLFEAILFSWKLLKILVKLLMFLFRKSYMFFKIFCELYQKTNKSNEKPKNNKPSSFFFIFSQRKRFIKSNFFHFQGTKRIPYSKESKDILKEWFTSNFHFPYASIKTKEELANKTRLNTRQVSFWLANERKKSK